MLKGWGGTAPPVQWFEGSIEEDNELPGFEG